MALKSFVANTVLPALNRAVAFTGLKLVPRSTPNRTFAEFLDHLKRLDFLPRTIIDVGVAEGSPGLHNPNLGATFYLVEPIPKFGPLIDRIAKKLGGEAFNVAAHHSDETVVLNLHEDGSGSSIFCQQEGKIMDGVPIEVPGRRLDGLLPHILARPCLLKIDTQGAEINVLKGASGLLDQIDVIILELSFHEFRHGIPEMAECVEYMRSLGYECYETLEGHYRPLDNAMAQIDLAFVKADSPLRADKSMLNPEQAKRYVA